MSIPHSTSPFSASGSRRDSDVVGEADVTVEEPSGDNGDTVDVSNDVTILEVEDVADSADVIVVDIVAADVIRAAIVLSFKALSDDIADFATEFSDKASLRNFAAFLSSSIFSFFPSPISASLRWKKEPDDEGRGIAIRRRKTVSLSDSATCSCALVGASSVILA